MTLTEFLLARIAEDQWEIGAAVFGHDDSAGPNGIGWVEVGAISEVLMSSHRRALAECEAKQQIIAEYEASEFCERTALGEIVLILAAVYAGHPDYNEEWRP